MTYLYLLVPLPHTQPLSWFIYEATPMTYLYLLVPLPRTQPLSCSILQVTLPALTGDGGFGRCEEGTAVLGISLEAAGPARPCWLDAAPRSAGTPLLVPSACGAAAAPFDLLWTPEGGGLGGAAAGLLPWVLAATAE
jgi:hypothetical protein